MNDTQEYILQKSIDNLIKMVDKLNKDLETVSLIDEQTRSTIGDALDRLIDINPRNKN